MAPKAIAVVTGGYSGESVISYQSAQTINAHLDREKYTPYTIDIRADGWWYLPASGNPVAVDRNDFSILLNGEKVHFAAALIAMHGTPGEDGKLQGYFDMLKIPYTSCNAATSSLTFNKRFTVAVAAMAGIHVARSLHFYQKSKIDFKAIAASLRFPLFVKPANGGSSIGMSKVGDAQGLESAFAKAFAEDDQVLVEEYVEGREFTVGVCRLQEKVVVFPLTEVVSENYFFDFEAKYQGKSRETTPAEVDERIANKVRNEARRVYEVFNCKGVVRIDFIYNETLEAPFMLEINTVPGQSAASIIPQQVRAMGWTLSEFYTLLIEECLS